VKLVYYRILAHQNGVYSYFDPKCTSDIVGINGPLQKPILDTILKINQQTTFNTVLDRISIGNPNEWLVKDKLIISVDFETINSVFDDFSQLPYANRDNWLFMIGVGVSFHDCEPEYQMFLLAELSINAEYQLVDQFYNYLRYVTDKYLGSTFPIPNLIHWGHIERSYFKSLCDKLKQVIGKSVHNRLDFILNNIKWYDMCNAFKKNRVAINGCVNFGLKEIAGRLNKLGLVKSNWNDTGSPCTNGNTAMVMAYDAYKYANINKIPVTYCPIMEEIMIYNKIDCYVLHEILDVLHQKVLSLHTT
jgi:hypothetical protein